MRLLLPVKAAKATCLTSVLTLPACVPQSVKSLTPWKKSSGRHRAEIKLVSGAYGSIVNEDSDFQ